jgi:hypothetical protein
MLTLHSRARERQVGQRSRAHANRRLGGGAKARAKGKSDPAVCVRKRVANTCAALNIKRAAAAHVDTERTPSTHAAADSPHSDTFARVHDLYFSGGGGGAHFFLYSQQSKGKMWHGGFACGNFGLGKWKNYRCGFGQHVVLRRLPFVSVCCEAPWRFIIWRSSKQWEFSIIVIVRRSLQGNRADSL